MIELELKAPAGPATLERLLAHGDPEERRERDTYHAHPARDFRATDEALRVRERADGRIEVTYKGPKLDPRTKSRREITLAVDDLDATLALLESLGFERAFVIAKRRRVWRIEGFEVSYDEVEGLEPFVEIEKAGATEADVAAFASLAPALADRLGIGASVRASYAELLGH
ncbi:MAG TPA: class IV adenylate cyclase [Candidatus Thermoplasmatota archaeon]|nr:class IV adenylate cyclase [Candidatus Thermoplasmatota archaeon]